MRTSSSTTLDLARHRTSRWSIVADVNQDHAAVAALRNLLGRRPAAVGRQLERISPAAPTSWSGLVAAADGLQHHGRAADHGASLRQRPLQHHARRHLCRQRPGRQRDDLLDFVRVRNRAVLASTRPSLPACRTALHSPNSMPAPATTGVPDLIRLCYEYLPLTFSRRHGDPSRPWNRFSINLKQARRHAAASTTRATGATSSRTGSRWPGPIPCLRRGHDRQVPQRHHRRRLQPLPGDARRHRVGSARTRQSLVQHRLLERPPDHLPAEAAGSRRAVPSRRAGSAARTARLQPMPTCPTAFAPMPRCSRTGTTPSTSTGSSEEAIAAAWRDWAPTASWCATRSGQVFHVTLAEKLLVLLLAKLANLVPEGGIWMNTQRPEWNDANNALVGKGLSVVTAAYLRRFIVFCQALLAAWRPGCVDSQLSRGRSAGRRACHPRHEPALAANRLQRSSRGAPSWMRWAPPPATIGWRFYHDGLAAAQVDDSWRRRCCRALLDAGAGLRRPDAARQPPAAMASITPTTSCACAGEGVAVDHLYEMLEGQVAVLSSGLLASDEALALLQTLRGSQLYRADQHSYILYPDRELPGFLQQEPGRRRRRLRRLALVAALTAANDRTLLVRDENGVYHFNGAFRNARRCRAAAARLAHEPALRASWSLAERACHPRPLRGHLRPSGLHRPLRHLLRLRGAGQHLLAHGLQAAAGRAGMLLAGGRGRGRRLRHGRRWPPPTTTSAPASASTSPPPTTAPSPPTPTRTPPRAGRQAARHDRPGEGRDPDPPGRTGRVSAGWRAMLRADAVGPR